MSRQEKVRVNSVVLVEVNKSVKQMVFRVLGSGLPNEGAITFHPTRASATLTEEATYQGWEKRIRNAAAIDRDKATPRMRYDAIKRLVDHIETGTEDWELTREGAGASMASDRKLLINAVMRVKGDEGKRASVEATIKDFTIDDVRRMLLQEPYRSKADEIRAEETKAVKTDDLLAKIDAL